MANIKILIEVEGGVVTAVFSSSARVAVAVRDYDDMSQGDGDVNSDFAALEKQHRIL